MAIADQEHLLFGVLAVQLGLASPAQVMAAAAGWMANPEMDMVERLQGDDLLSAKQVGMLRAMVAEAIRVHGGDVHQTLGALGGAEAIQQTFAGSLVLDARGVISPAVGNAPPAPAGALDLAPRRSGDLVADTLETPPVGSPAQDATERYALGEEFGRGGQARVLLAVDKQLGREVAWKELLVGQPLGTAGEDGSSRRSISASARFLREARITGQLEHPNIVPVHELGVRADGRHYYTMRLVRGRTLAEAIGACQGLAERLRLLEAFVAICHAVAFAHSRGVVHRDLKPNNVMVGEFGETVLLDWGLAKRRGMEDDRGEELERHARWLQEGDGSSTMVGAALGTPSYMSPEQAAGDVDHIDERSDVWGLGAVLYEILSGRPPFVGETPFEIVGKVLREEPESILGHCPDAPVELVAVAVKALQRDRDQRYPSAVELAEEISAYLTGGRVKAYEYSSLELLRRFAGKNKAIIAAASLALLVILIALIKTQIAYREESRARTGEARAREAAQQERLLASYHLAQAYAEKADRFMEQRCFDSGRIFAVASLLHNPAYAASSSFDKAFEARYPASRELSVSAASRIYRSQLSLGVRQKARFSARDQIKQLRYSPGGKRLAGASHDGMVLVWDAESGQVRQRWKAHSAGAFAVAFLDSDRLVSGGGKGEVKLWSLDGGPRLIRAFEGHEGSVTGLALSSDGTRLATAANERSARIWDLESGRCLHVLGGHEGAVWGLDFSPDGQLLATASWDKKLRIWRSGDGSLLHTIGHHDDAIYAAKFSPDGKILATACYDSRIRLFDPFKGTLLQTLAGHTDAVYDLEFSPDGRLLLSGGFDRHFRIFDLSKGKLVYSLEGHKDAVASVDMAPDHVHFASAGFDGVVKIWRLENKGMLHTLDGHDDWVYGLQYGPKGQRLISAGWDKRVIVWDMEKESRLWTYDGLRAGSMSATISPKGDLAAVADVEGWVYVWDLASGCKLHEFRAHPQWIYQLRFSPDGRRIITASRDHQCRVFDARSGRLMLELRGSDGMMHDGIYSPDGRRIATSSRDRTVRIWDATSGEELKTLRGHEDWVSGISYSADGRLLASSSKDRQIILWDAESGQLIKRFRGHRQWVNTVVFSPGGDLLASASDDATVVLWSVASGRAVMELQAASGVSGVDFSPDGRYLVVGDHLSIKRYPLNFDLNAIDAHGILEETQAAIGQRLEGFKLVMADAKDP